MRITERYILSVEKWWSADSEMLGGDDGRHSYGNSISSRHCGANLIAGRGRDLRSVHGVVTHLLWKYGKCYCKFRRQLNPPPVSLRDRGYDDLGNMNTQEHGTDREWLEPDRHAGRKVLIT